MRCAHVAAAVLCMLQLWLGMVITRLPAQRQARLPSPALRPPRQPAGQGPVGCCAMPAMQVFPWVKLIASLREPIR